VAGAIPQRDVVAALAQSDLLFLPTLGENYGHAIVDALTAGTSVLISDQTPWRSLATEDAGRDLPLSNPTAFLEALEELARASPQTRAAMRAGARRYIERRLDPAADAAQLEQCLRAAMRPTEAK
jgi:glycosyltransferase involved in cell wall biosynthesis